VTPGPAAPTTLAADPSPTWPFAIYRPALLAALIIGYMGYYVCRQNFADAHDLLVRDLGITNQTFGDIASAGVLVYAAGKFLGGPLTDSFGGRRAFFIGLFGSVVATILIGATGGAALAFVFVFWCVNRGFQSLGWAGLVNIVSHWFTAAEYGTAAGWLSVSYQFGGFAASVLAAWLVAHVAGWRVLFFVPAGVLFALGLLLAPIVASSPVDVGYQEPVEPGTTANAPEPPMPVGARLRLLLGNSTFLIVCFLSFVLTLIRESLNTWLPAYLSSLGNTTASAILTSSLYPLLGCAGTIAAGWISDRWFRHNRGPILAGFLAVAAGVLLGLGHLPAVSAAAATLVGADRGTVASVFVGLTGFFILAPYSMVGGGVYALDYGGRRAPATAVGLLDGFGYFGAALSGWGVGKLLALGHDDWRPVFTIMTWAVFGTAILSMMLTELTRRTRAAGHPAA